MNRMKQSLLLPVALLLGACEQKTLEMPDMPDHNAPVPLQLSSGISTATTRAFDSSWESGDQIGVFTTKAGSKTNITQSGSWADENIAYKVTTGAETYHGTPGSYTYQAFESSDATKKIYLPADGADVDVYAYYPYTDGVSDAAPLNITIPTSQSDANQKSIDVLKASALTTASAPIDIDHTTAQLLFTHVMSKVLVYVKVGEGYAKSDIQGNITSVVLTGQPTKATFAPIVQSLTIKTGNHNITMLPLTTGDRDLVTDADVIHCYRAIILPNDATNNPVTNGTERQLIFSVGDVTYTYNIKQNFVGGTETAFFIKLGAEEIIVEASIQPWTEAPVVTPPNSLTPDSN